MPNLPGGGSVMPTLAAHGQQSPADAAWARLRQLGARRALLVTAATADAQQLRDLLDCVWPAVPDAAGSPFRSAS